jgi:hypothetical protein
VAWRNAKLSYRQATQIGQFGEGRRRGLVTQPLLDQAQAPFGQAAQGFHLGSATVAGELKCQLGGDQWVHQNENAPT